MAFLLCSPSPMNPIYKDLEFPISKCIHFGLPGGTSGKESACQCRRHKRRELNPWVRKIPRRRAWQPTSVFLPGESHEQRNLAGYTVQGVAKSQTPLKQLSTQCSTCTFSPTHVISLAQWSSPSLSHWTNPHSSLKAPSNNTFYLWSFPGVPRVSHRSVRATRYFLQILLRPLLTSGDRDGTAFMFPSPKPRLQFHSFIHRYTWHLVWNEWTHRCIKPIDRGVLRVPSSCHYWHPPSLQGKLLQPRREIQFGNNQNTGKLTWVSPRSKKRSPYPPGHCSLPFSRVRAHPALGVATPFSSSWKGLVFIPNKTEVLGANCFSCFCFLPGN